MFRLPADVTADAFVEATDRHRLMPFFSLNLDRLDLADDLRATIAARGQRERMPALMMARELFRAVDALSDAGVRVLTFKGIALAQQAYGDFTARGSGDLDLLVSPDDLVTARTALVDAGWAADPAYPEPGPSWAWRFVVSNFYELALSGPTSAIDLHWAPDPNHSSLPPFDVLWGRRSTVELAGRPLDTLGSTDALLQSCGHAAKDDWAWLRSLVDIHLLASAQHALGEPPRLTRAQRRSLGVAFDGLGTPRTAPPAVHRAARLAGHRSLPLARRRQESELVTSVGRAPGHGTLMHLRRVGRGVSSLGDARRLVVTMVIPPGTLGDTTAASFTEALGTSARRRSGRARRRFIDWGRW
ncbi:nucleotidyltransferase family protein [Nocardioides alkalitolerans]|uniref:nucleotidyltransferase family protein n=1 Tax=Nocardioides alkalitolerans TaxID=281714 RepID=UPI0012FA05BE|nr:nucleotidyltransferase family protein [Nocardioides alkalitolerans]